MGFLLYLLQKGKNPDNSKSLKGNKFNGVSEITINYDTDTYRIIYTIKIDDYLYILHTFKKKSTKGINTPKKELDTIESRLKQARELNTRLTNE